MVTSSSTTNYEFNSLMLNPGYTRFPWLHREAQLWQQYHVNSMSFRYVPSAGTAVPGTVSMMVDYGTTDTQPGDLQTLSSSSGAVTGPIWAGMRLDLDVGTVHGAGPRKWTRDGIAGGSPDTKDIGTLYVGWQGVTALTPISVWVDYDITFFMPNLSFVQDSPGLVGGELITRGNTYSHLWIGANQNLTNNAWVYPDWSVSSTSNPLRVSSALVGAPATYNYFLPGSSAIVMIAELVCWDNANEDFTVHAELLRSTGASFSPVISSYGYAKAIGGQSFITLNFVGLASVPDGEGFRIGVYATGAAGLLQILPGSKMVITGA